MTLLSSPQPVIRQAGAMGMGVLYSQNKFHTGRSLLAHHLQAPFPCTNLSNANVTV